MKRAILSFATLLLCVVSSSAQSQQKPFEWSAGDNTTIKLGGFVRVMTSVDTKGSVAGNDFITNTISSKKDWSQANHFVLDPYQTRLSLEVVQKSEALGDIKAYFETDFRGAGNTLRMRQAYVEAKGFIVGQTWSFVTDLASNAPTIDIQGVNSRSFLRSPLVGYRHQISESISAGISAEFPSFNFDPSQQEYHAVNQNTPDVPIYVMMNTEDVHLKAAAIFRSLQYGNTDKEERQSQIGSGIQISCAWSVVPCVKLYAQSISGKGIARYINDLASQSIDLMPINKELELGTTPMTGNSFGIGWTASEKISLAASYSAVNVDGDEDRFRGEIKASDYLSATLFYNATPKLQLGAEFLSGSRTNFGGSKATAQRVALMLKYSL